MEDTESCCSRPVDFSPTLTRKQKLKVNIYNEVLRRLMSSDVADAKHAGFEDELWAHFNRLPTRYVPPNPSLLSLSLSLCVYLCMYVIGGWNFKCLLSHASFLIPVFVFVAYSLLTLLHQNL